MASTNRHYEKSVERYPRSSYTRWSIKSQSRVKYAFSSYVGGRNPSTFNKSTPTHNTKHVVTVDTHGQSDDGSSALCAGKTTTVVNVRKAELRKLGYKDLVDWLQYPDQVYIGRDMTQYVPGAKGSKWGNLFKSKQCGREVSCARYREYVLTERRVHDNGRTLLESLGELKGKTLGCWCHPEQCHSNKLVKLIDEHCK